jgi:hypothetical protein
MYIIPETDFGFPGESGLKKWETVFARLKEMGNCGGAA